jgi:hypothetical protein
MTVLLDGNVLPRSATAITSRQWHIGREQALPRLG